MDQKKLKELRDAFVKDMDADDVINAICFLITQTLKPKWPSAEFILIIPENNKEISKTYVTGNVDPSRIEELLTNSIIATVEVNRKSSMN